MKNLILISILSLALSSCSNSGSNSTDGSSLNPVVPNDLSDLLKDQLYKSEKCYPEANNRSSRHYITKTDRNSEYFLLEADLFASSDCENSLGEILITAKTSMKLKGYEYSTSSGFYTLTFEQIDTGFIFYSQSEMDIYNIMNLLIANGQWSLNIYKSIAGQSTFPENGHLSTHEFKFNSGLISLDGDLFQ